VRLPTRLALVAVLVLGLTLAAVALLTYQLVRVSGRQSVDRALRRELAALVAGLPGELPAGGNASTADLGLAAQRYLALHPGSDEHMLVIEVGGSRYTTREGPSDLVRLEQGNRLPDGEPGRLRTVDTPTGPVRMLTSAVEADGQAVGTATVVGSLDDARSDASSALARVALAGAVGLVVGGTALTLVTRRALRPVSQLADAARATGGDDLSRRVPEPDRSDEPSVLAHEFNRMLDRIAADAEDRQRLLAAISHELRTPLAVARGHLEVFDGTDSAELAAVLTTELDRMTRIVADLSVVAGGAAGGEGGYDVQVGPVFVPDVLDDLRDRVAGLGLDGVTVGTAPPAVVAADEDRLAQSLLNLVLNATVHTPEGTHVRVTATADGTGDGSPVVLAVHDDGPGIDPSVRDRVFEPFVTTRPRRGEGRSTGLGLAVVKTLTEAQGGTVDLTTGDGGTTVALRFVALE
jgi:two-component system, OmpR family, sensor kinase